MEFHYGLLKLYGNEFADRYYIDCIGYVIARRMGVLFLTGDKEFEGLESAEFVK